MYVIEGRVWVFGDNVDTDAIVAGEYLDAPIEETIKHVFASLKPDFVNEVRQGDVIVAGKNFGCGSSRENAPASLKAVGIKCIIAESFARIFFRNAIAIGLPVISALGVPGRFQEGDTASIDFSRSMIVNVTDGDSLPAEPLADEMIEILDSGGILEVLRRHGGGNQ